jgi:signal transduction histidine kinase
MNRLWMRLSLAFSAVVLVGVLAIVVIGVLIVRIEGPDSLRASGGLIEGLADYYRSHGTWQGVDAFLDGAQHAIYPDTHLLIQLRDENNVVLYNPYNTPLSLTDPFFTLPVVVEGHKRGALSIFEPARGLTSDLPVRPQGFWLARIRDFLVLVAAVGGVVGILFGVLVSRSLTAPLEKLAVAAQAIGNRALHHRVEARGSAEIVEVASAFNNMAAELETAETLRRNLVADVAHELRTPLSVLQGNLMAILDGVYPLDTSEVARLYTHTQLLSRLVNDLHELSQAESRQLHLNRQDTSIQQLLKNILEAFIPTADAAEVKLDFIIPSDLPTVCLDPMRFTQIIDNLLSNALRYTPAGGTITLNVEAVDNYMQLSVKDTGEGIATEHLPHVFDRFYRTNKGRSRSTGGVGLGLTIVRAIVEMHGGTVSVSSEGVPGKGTTFVVKLPLRSQ